MAQCEWKPCGQKVQAGWQFCPYCGTDNRPSTFRPGIIACPHLFHESESFCVRCGSSRDGRPSAEQRQVQAGIGKKFITSAAIASDGTLVFGSSDTNFYALSPTGSLLWKNAAQGTLMSSPTISGDGTIYLIASDGNFYAVPSAGGASVWHLKLGTYGRSSAAVGTDGTLYVGSTDSNLYAIN